MKVIKRIGPAPRNRIDTDLGGTVLTFWRLPLFDGSVVMVARMPAAEEFDGDGYDRLLATIALHAGRLVVIDLPPLAPDTQVPWQGAVPPVIPAAVDLPPPAPADRIPQPVWLALKRGWTEDDLSGTGNGGDFGEAGGRSMSSGLTCAEMALSDPPPRWAVLAGKVYAWQVEGWQPPGIGWEPPTGLIDRVVADDDDDDDDDAPVDADTDTDTDTDGGDAPIDGNGDGDGDGDGDAPAALAAYAPEKVDALLALMRQAIADGGSLPTVHKFRYLAGKAGLSPVSNDAYDVLALRVAAL